MSKHNSNASMADVYAAQDRLRRLDFAKAETKERPHLWEPEYPPRLAGIPVHTAPGMTKTVTITRTRPWRERLFAWPWRPWVATEVQVTQVPSDEVFLLNLDGLGFDMSGMRGQRIVMHPDTFSAVKLEVKS